MTMKSMLNSYVMIAVKHALIIWAVDQYLSSLLGDRNPLRESVNEVSLGSTHLYLGRVRGNLNALWQCNRHSSNT